MITNSKLDHVGILTDLIGGSRRSLQLRNQRQNVAFHAILINRMVDNLENKITKNHRLPELFAEGVDVVEYVVFSPLHSRWKVLMA